MQPEYTTLNAISGGYSLSQKKPDPDTSPTNPEAPDIDESEIEVPTMFINVSNKKDGNQGTVALEGPRFDHRELYPGSQLQAFRIYNGWSILESLVHIILFYRPYSVVEIGCGESTEILLPAAVEADVDFYAVDVNLSKLDHFKKAANLSGQGNYQFYHMTSNEFMAQYDDIPAVVLIDANHEYSQAKKEFEFFYNLLIPGGVIFLHDTFPPHEMMLAPTACHDVYRLRQELEPLTEEMDVFTWPYTAGFSGLTMIIKKDPDRPYYGR